MIIVAHYSFLIDECPETQIKNPFDPILGFDLIKDFWNWIFLSLKKDFQRTHIIKVVDGRKYEMIITY